MLLASHWSRSRILDRERAPLACALVALVVSALSVGALLAATGWNLTALIRLAPEDPIVPLVQRFEPDVVFIPGGHYDGVYYYAIAVDPLARGEAHMLIDLGAHRYGHPGFGWLAWLASLGRAAWVPQVMLGLSLAGMAIAAYITSLIARDLGATPWAGLLVALNPGLVFAVATDTSEAAAAALLAGGLYLWIRDRRLQAAPLLAAVCFFKFQLVLVPIGLGLFELIRYLNGERDRPLIPNLALLAAGPVAFGAWMLYVFGRFAELPTALAPSLLSFPFVGWFDTMARAGRIHELGFSDVQLASAELPILACLLALFCVGLLLAFRMRHPLDAVFLLQGLLVLALNWWNLYYPKDLIRSLSIPLLLLAPVIYGYRASRARTSVEDST